MGHVLEAPGGEFGLNRPQRKRSWWLRRFKMWKTSLPCEAKMAPTKSRNLGRVRLHPQLDHWGRYFYGLRFGFGLCSRIPPGHRAISAGNARVRHRHHPRCWLCRDRCSHDARGGEAWIRWATFSVPYRGKSVTMCAVNKSIRYFYFDVIFAYFCKDILEVQLQSSLDVRSGIQKFL